MDEWLKQHLICPRDDQHLQLEEETLICPLRHTYPCIDGIPVMLLEEVPPTHRVCSQSVHQARSGSYVVSLNRIEQEAYAVDSFVQKEISATNGIMYRHLIGSLPRYPIPKFLLMPQTDKDYLLDIGCNWGRWSIAAARKGFKVVGIDPSLEAIMAARRVANQLNTRAIFVVADGRHIPFSGCNFDTVFSYSVLQHFSECDVEAVLTRVAQVLKPGGTSLIQMANRFGVRNLYHQMRRGFKKPIDFQVRYRHPSQLRTTFEKFIGPSRVFVDGFFALNPQESDLDLLPLRYQIVIQLSNVLRRLSEKVRGAGYLADSLYIQSKKNS